MDKFLSDFLEHMKGKIWQCLFGRQVIVHVVYIWPCGGKNIQYYHAFYTDTSAFLLKPQNLFVLVSHTLLHLQVKYRDMFWNKAYIYWNGTWPGCCKMIFRNAWVVSIFRLNINVIHHVVQQTVLTLSSPRWRLYPQKQTLYGPHLPYAQSTWLLWCFWIYCYTIIFSSFV